MKMEVTAEGHHCVDCDTRIAFPKSKEEKPRAQKSEAVRQFVETRGTSSSAKEIVPKPKFGARDDILDSFYESRMPQPPSGPAPKKAVVPTIGMMKAKPGEEPRMWQVETDWGWHDFNADMQELLVKAVELGAPELIIKRGKHRYRIEFASMTQTNQKTSTSRDIRFGAPPEPPFRPQYVALPVGAGRGEALVEPAWKKRALMSSPGRACRDPAIAVARSKTGARPPWWRAPTALDDRRVTHTPSPSGSESWGEWKGGDDRVREPLELDDDRVRDPLELEDDRVHEEEAATEVIADDDESYMQFLVLPLQICEVVVDDLCCTGCEVPYYFEPDAEGKNTTVHFGPGPIEKVMAVVQDVEEHISDLMREYEANDDAGDREPVDSDRELPRADPKWTAKRLRPPRQPGAKRRGQPRIRPGSKERADYRSSRHQ